LVQAEDSAITGTYAAEDVVQFMVIRPAADAGFLGFKNFWVTWRED